MSEHMPPENEPGNTPGNERASNPRGSDDAVELTRQRDLLSQEVSELRDRVRESPSRSRDLENRVLQLQTSLQPQKRSMQQGQQTPWPPRYIRP